MNNKVGDKTKSKQRKTELHNKTDAHAETFEDV